MFDLVLKNGQIVGTEKIQLKDVLVKAGKIVDLVDNFEGEAQEILDCSEKFILPGAIDPHVHFRTPGQEYKEDWDSGSRAAVAGGVTTVFDMPNNSPATISEERLIAKRELIKNKSWVNYGLYIGATADNAAQLSAVRGVCGVKVYMGSSSGDLLVSEKAQVENIFKQVDDKILCFHAETEALLGNPAGVLLPEMHSRLRPPAAALDALSFVLDMAEKYQRRVHICHVTTAGEAELLKKRKSALISAEVTPQHLFLDESVYERLKNYAKVNPPLRKSFDREALWQALKDGVIDMLATDHAPHTKAEKERDYFDAPAGMPGLDTMLPLLLNEVCVGNMTLMEVVRVTSYNAARRFGLAGRGEIISGAAADLVVVDMDERKKVDNADLKSKCGWSPFEGWGLRGWPYATLVNGKIAYYQGQFVGQPGGMEVF